MPGVLDIPVIGPSSIPPTCYLAQASQDFLKYETLGCIEVDIDEMNAYDDKEDVFLMLAYANVLHDRNWSTIDVASGNPVLRPNEAKSGCKETVMMSWQAVPGDDDRAQLVFIRFGLDDDDSECELQK